MVNSLRETSRGVFGAGLSVCFEGVLECVCHVVGFAELGTLNVGRLGVVVRTGYDVGAREREGGGEGRGTFSYAIPASWPACCNLYAPAALMYSSAAFSYFSVLEPNQLKPESALE